MPAHRLTSPIQYPVAQGGKAPSSMLLLLTIQVALRMKLLQSVSRIQMQILPVRIIQMSHQDTDDVATLVNDGGGCTAGHVSYGAMVGNWHTILTTHNTGSCTWGPKAPLNYAAASNCP